MKNFYNIEYIPTGLVYNIEKAEAQRLLTEEPENFRLADDEKLELPKEEPETTIKELVMEKEEEKPAKKPAKKAKK